MAINNEKLDRRVKLLEADKEEMRGLEGQYSTRELARMYGVSRRTVQFVLDPQKLIENKLRRKERGGSAQYYDREAHKKAMQEHRQYKRQLKKQGLI